MRQKLFLLIGLLGVLISGCSSDVSFTKIQSLQESLSGTYKTEDFVQNYNGKKLDILVVVDNSGSMAEEQEKLGQKIDSFLSTLYDIDWQLAITTTDVSDGAYGIKGDLLNFEGLNTYILTQNSPNYQQAFQNTIVRKEGINCSQSCPSGDEQPLRAAIMALEKRNTNNKGFFRPNADLGLLILSDEDEMSTGPSKATSPQSVITTVNNIWGDQKRVFTYGMVIQPNDTACFNENNGVGNYGDFVYELAQLTGGLTGSICDADYAPTLGLIGDHARHLINGVQLQLYPEVDTISINFTPSHKTEWTLAGRNISFENPPPKGTKIKVTYMVE